MTTAEKQTLRKALEILSRELGEDDGQVGKSARKSKKQTKTELRQGAKQAFSNLKL